MFGEPPISLTPLLVTAKEAARLLSISERTLWDLTDRGEIPAVRVVRAVRYSVADLQAWIERKKAAPTGASGGVRGEH